MLSSKKSKPLNRKQSSILKSSFLTILLTLTLAIPLAEAHVKWFVEKEEVTLSETAPFSLSETAVQGWIAMVLMGIIIAGLLEKKLPSLPIRWEKYAKVHQKQWIRGFQIILGITLLICAKQGLTPAPHVQATTVIRFFEAIAGILLLFNKGTPLAAGFILLSWASLWGSTDGVSAWEYINLVGIGLFLLFKSHVTSTASNFFKQYDAWALPLLRWFTGLALLVLAFTEKLLNPSSAMAFLEKYQFNFISPIGFSVFNDRLFILTAGSMEALFALIFLSGWIPRLNTAAIGVFLIASNAYFFMSGHVVEGWQELIGHLPILATAGLILTYGSGEKLRWPIKNRTSPRKRSVHKYAARQNIQNLKTQIL